MLKSWTGVFLLRKSGSILEQIKLGDCFFQTSRYAQEIAMIHVRLAWLTVFCCFWTFLSSPDGGKSVKQCGNWSQAYTTLHKSILNSNDGKYIVAVPHIS